MNRQKQQLVRDLEAPREAEARLSTWLVSLVLLVIQVQI